MNDLVYPDIKGNIGPEIGNVVLRQRVITENGKQRVITEKHPDLPFHTLKCFQDVCTIENKKPLLKNSPQHETFKYHPSQEPELYSCSASGYEIMCRGVKCRAHIITQKVKPLKSNELNILIICKAHEKHFNDKPLKEWYTWVKKNYPDNFKSVHDNAKFVYEQLEEYFKIV